MSDVEIKIRSMGGKYTVKAGNIISFEHTESMGTSYGFYGVSSYGKPDVKTTGTAYFVGKWDLIESVGGTRFMTVSRAEPYVEAEL